VHYYEDGNVRLLTERPISSSLPSASASELVKQIAGIERRYQEELNRGFQNLSENAFKGLRRQLPVTRQKVEWDKIAAYKAGYVIHWQLPSDRAIRGFANGRLDKTSAEVGRNKRRRQPVGAQRLDVTT